MYMLVSLIWFTKLIQSCPSLLSSTLLFKSGQSCDLLSVKLYWSAMPYQELKSRYFGFSQQRNYIVEALDSIPGFISRLASCNDKVITPGKSAIISTYELLLSVMIVNTIKKTLHLVQRQPFPYFSVEFVLPRVNLQLRLFVRFRRHVCQAGVGSNRTPYRDRCKAVSAVFFTKEGKRNFSEPNFPGNFVPFSDQTLG